MVESISEKCLMSGCNFEEDCSVLLRVLEDAGMIPPRTLLQPMGIEDNAWDPETPSQPILQK